MANPRQRLHKKDAQSGSEMSTSKKETSTKGSSAHVLSLFSLGVVLAQIFCEVFKQLSNYSLQYFNGGKYPVPQTAIVVATEIIKLIATLIRSGGSIPSLSLSSLRTSVHFLVPSVLYAINNNIYFLGLTLVPPPIWLILCSSRTVVTATIYKFFLRRPLSAMQFVGAMLIVISIIIAKLPSLLSSGSSINAVPLSAIGLAILASINSVAAALYTEKLFKGGAKQQSFLDQQFWLYFYGIIIATIVHSISSFSYTPHNFVDDVSNLGPWILALFVCSLLFSSVGGLFVAAILKHLDNIVKEYAGSTANVITAVVCAMLFPDKFSLSAYIVVSMAFLFAGIFCYERFKIKSNK